MSIEKIENSFQPTPDGKCAVAESGMVATAFPDATRAGVEMLRLGGNAVDAACAAAIALGVCEPQGSGVGGQSMAILHVNGKTIALNGFGRVPSLANIDQLSKEERFIGYKATTVPSTVAVLGYLNARYGRLEWSTILQPAIRVAREGYRISPLQHELQTRELDSFLRVPSRSGARYFLKDGNRPYEAGDLFIQKDLSDLLSHLAEQGPEAFYTGKVARQIEEDMRANNGFLHAEDLARIPWPVKAQPLQCRYRDVTVCTIPPPAAGASLVLLLRMLNHFSSGFLVNDQPKSLHYIAETFRKVFLHRIQRPYDPRTFPQIPREKLLDSDFARQLAQSIQDTIDPALPVIEARPQQEETTHLSVMDADGNAVGITQSIEYVYGSKAAAQGLGFLYNNYMSALDVANPGHPFYLRPNAIPWSSVVPSILFYNDKPWIVAGTPGSERIYSAISQFIMHVVDSEAPISEAMLRPRFHCSLEGEISLEDRFTPQDIAYLERLGYRIERREPYSFYMGAIHAVLKRQNGSGFQGVAEIRRSGIAEGLS